MRQGSGCDGKVDLLGIPYAVSALTMMKGPVSILGPIAVIKLAQITTNALANTVIIGSTMTVSTSITNLEIGEEGLDRTISEDSERGSD